MAGAVAQEYAAHEIEHGAAAFFMRTVVDYGMDPVLTMGFDKRGLDHGRGLSFSARETLI